LKLEIKKIRLNELEGFVNSETFRHLTTVPITRLRTTSYIHNPNGKPDDVVLIMGFINNRLVAFRTIFAGLIHSNGEHVRFGWLSGNWIHPDFRRRGYSEQLLSEALIEWDGKLMSTNYAPESEKLFLKTGRFHPIHQFKGARAYLFPKTIKLFNKVNQKRIVKPFLSITDRLISIISEARLLFFTSKKPDAVRFAEIDTPDEECFQYNQQNNPRNIYIRNKAELNWIFQHPWISVINTDYIKKYPFSSYSESFRYKTVKIFTEGNFKGFFIFSLRNGHLKTLYFNIAGSSVKVVVNYLKSYCIENRIEIVTIYNSTIAKEFIAQKFPFLYIKKYGQKIYSSFKIKNGQELQFQDGDGDTFFT
jgi:hypothetical protein